MPTWVEKYEAEIVERHGRAMFTRLWNATRGMSRDDVESAMRGGYFAGCGVGTKARKILDGYLRSSAERCPHCGQTMPAVQS